MKAQHSTGDVLDIGFGDHPTAGRSRFEYIYNPDEEGTGRAYACLTLWPTTVEEVHAVFAPTAPRGRRGFRHSDRPCGWQDRVASIYTIVGGLGWTLTKRERRLLERVTAEWAPGLLADRPSWTAREVRTA